MKLNTMNNLEASSSHLSSKISNNESHIDFYQQHIKFDNNNNSNELLKSSLKINCDASSILDNSNIDLNSPTSSTSSSNSNSTNSDMISQYQSVLLTPQMSIESTSSSSSFSPSSPSPFKKSTSLSSLSSTSTSSAISESSLNFNETETILNTNNHIFTINNVDLYTTHQPIEHPLQPANTTHEQTPKTLPYSTISSIKGHPLYKIQEKIRTGGFGDVYKGTRKIDNTPIAIKIINKEKITTWSKVRLK